MKERSRADIRREDVAKLLRNNPGLTLTLGYVTASLVGLLFSWSLLRRFGLNILDYTEVTDFLIAALREPLTFVVAASAIPVVYLLRWLAGLERKFWQRHPPRTAMLKRYTRLAERAYRDPLAETFILLAYAFLFIMLYSEWKADQIRAGNGQRVDIEIGWEDETSRVNRILVGGTTRFLFVYDIDGGRMEAIPHESMLRVLSIPKKPKTGLRSTQENATKPEEKT